MSQHSVADAKDRLPELIERALRGEDTVIRPGGITGIRMLPAGTL